MDLGNGLGHLTYSTLVHPGDDWEQMWTSLTTYVPKVKARIAHNQRFGVSLRLSANSAQTLVNSKAEREKLKKFLGDNDMYLYTVNAFPYGAFKGTVVKEQVYEPDWRSEERTQYTINVADVLADVVPAGISPSIQSAPLGFKPRVTGDDVVASYTDHVLRVAAHLVALEARTGRTVTLALEPEPYCFLETTDETVDYFTDISIPARPPRRLARLAQHADLGSACRAAPACRHGVRHLPSGGRIREHRGVAAEAGRRRHPDLQAAGSRRAAHAAGDAADRRHA